MKLKELSLNLELGQKILVGPNNEQFHEKSGEIAINTTKGPRKALTFRLTEDETAQTQIAADKYR
jgi:hypothetical protein